MLVCAAFLSNGASVTVLRCAALSHCRCIPGVALCRVTVSSYSADSLAIASSYSVTTAQMHAELCHSRSLVFCPGCGVVHFTCCFCCLHIRCSCNYALPRVCHMVSADRGRVPMCTATTLGGLPGSPSRGGSRGRATPCKGCCISFQL